jgi:ribosome-binding factor A
VSSVRKRRREPLRAEDVRTSDEPDPEIFFGDAAPSRKGTFKALQLCKQVARAVSVTLASEWLDDALDGACVASVDPAPDASRLRVVVVMAPGREPDAIGRARAALQAASAEFRAEVARSIHRKRTPEVVFDVRPWSSVAEEVEHE